MWGARKVQERQQVAEVAGSVSKGHKSPCLGDQSVEELLRLLMKNAPCPDNDSELKDLDAAVQQCLAKALTGVQRIAAK